MIKRIIISSVLFVSVFLISICATIELEHDLQNLKNAVAEGDIRKVSDTWNDEKELMYIFLDYESFNELNKIMNVSEDFSASRKEIFFLIDEISSSLLPKIKNIL